MTEEQPAHKKTEEYWDRKWKLAVRGAEFAGFVLVLGVLITLIKGTEMGEAIYPYTFLGVTGGLSLVFAYVGNATAVEIFKKF